MKEIKIVIALLVMLVLQSCTPYKKDQVLFEYDDLGVLYYLKDESEIYKYNDFIYDDITSGEYKNATPNIADFKNGSGALDYDIDAYVNAKMDYVIKNELIKKYGIKIDNICDMIRSENFIYNKSYIYYYDKNTKENKLLCDLPVTNISYDNEFPKITFDIENENTEKIFDSFKNRKIKLSDIIAANSTPDAFMKVILSQGKEKCLYIMDKRVDNDEMYGEVKVSSESTVK